MKVKFPERFFWGVAASAPQTEGAAREDGKGLSVWDYWSHHEPEQFWQAAKPDLAADFYHRYRQDIALFRELGWNSYRLSIAWTRIFPDGYGEVNQRGVQFYRDLLREFHDNRITPFVNLYHFDMPWSLQKRGGWENPLVGDYFADYCRFCFETFGDLVEYWLVMNEPIVAPECCYLSAHHYPQVSDSRAAVQVAHNILVACAKAVRAFRQVRPGGKIGNILNVSPTYPVSDRPADRAAADAASLLLVDSFLRPVLIGGYSPELTGLIGRLGLTPKKYGDDLSILAEGTVDFLGVNYYQPRRVRQGGVAVADAGPGTEIGQLFEAVQLPDARYSDRGWEIYPPGLYDLLMLVKTRYRDLPVLVSENGIGNRRQEREDQLVEYDAEGRPVAVHDQERIEFIRDHLAETARAIADGVNVIGYHLWTGLDCFSWVNGYRNVYGLIRVDYNSGQRDRLVKDSGWWFREVIANNGW
ncbi:MAG: glycoside hydrolase family 1 protein [Negativicutes bacterium]|nr:glycoside hydrolase family 1 protein [Negativicutes bacterium]